jgi:hypothetical protein
MRSALQLVPALVLSAPLFAQSALDHFDPVGAVILGDQSRLECIADVDGDGNPEAVGWWIYQHQQGSLVGHVRMEALEVDPASGAWTVHRSPNNFYVTVMSDLTRTAVADFDGNGDDEIVLFVPYTNTSFPAGEWLLQLSMFDFDAGLVPYVFEGVYGPQSTAGDQLAATVGDFDLDGRDDLVAYDGQRITYWRSVATDITNFNLPVLDRIGSIPGYGGRMELATADVQGDAAPELIALQDHGVPAVWVFPMSASGFGVGARYFPDPTPGGEILSLTTGDVDLDGDIDIVLFGHDGRYQTLRNSPAGLALEGRNVGGPATRLADSDGDGDLDGICCGGGGTTVTPQNTLRSTFHLCMNDGTGAFDQAVAFTGLGGRHVAGVLDLDRDGDVEVIAGRAAVFGRSFVGATYCAAAPNSTGLAAELASAGHHSVSAGGAHLTGSGLPPFSTCVLLASPVLGPGSLAARPFWNGNLCLSSTGLFRALVSASDASGQVDLGSTASFATGIAGTQHGLQLWYRDVAAGGTFADVSNALRVLATH